MNATEVRPPRRINRGRGHSYELDGGRPADGVTAVIRNGIPKPQFEESSIKKTAGYAIDHWEELSELPLHERYETLRRAKWQALSAAGERGTDVHKLAHRLAAGEEVRPPEELEPYVDSYLRFEKECGLREVTVETDAGPVALVEAVLGNRKHGYMGTLDTIAELELLRDGLSWLLDFKTTQSGVWPESALQLAAYARGEFLLVGGREYPFPKVDAGAVVWLRMDGYDVVPVDISEGTFRTFLYAQQVARFVTAPREDYIGEALEAPRGKE
jgi:hypothetical protein